jgi:hypothetical protein
MPDMSNGAVAALAASLVASMQERDDLLTDWLNGTSDGGPQGDGRYPLPSPTGTVLVPCWASITDPVAGAEAGATQSAADAADIKTQIDAVKAQIDTIKTAIDASLSTVTSLRDEAQARANDAASEHAAARAEREACETIQTNIQALYDEWSASPS